MNALTKIALFLFAVFATILLINHGDRALHASTPRDMPADSHFVQTGFDVQHNEARGQWIACQADTINQSDFCRVTDTHGTVVYEGNFAPISHVRALPNSQLKLASAPENARLWVQGPAEAGPIPVIPLQGGDLLVPAQDRDALRDRWASNPQELRDIQGN